MSKKDPAFLFYDGDAARDVSHLNRLERGCYFDIIQAQRKFGRLSIDLIKKILGNDFNNCWEQVKICLSYDKHMYYIDWLEISIRKRTEYSESRRKNRTGEKLISYEEDMINISKSYDNHMEIENINENINKDKIEGMGERKGFNQKPICTDDVFKELPQAQIKSAIDLIGLTQQVNASEKQINTLWDIFKVQHLTGNKYYESIDKVYNYFNNWSKTQKIANGQQPLNGGSKLGTSAARNQAANNF